MRHKDRTQIELAAIIKMTRTDIRLEHSLAADIELNQVLPGLENEYWYAVLDGQPFFYDRAARQIVLSRDKRERQPNRSSKVWAPSRVDPEAFSMEVTA